MSFLCNILSFFFSSLWCSTSNFSYHSLKIGQKCYHYQSFVVVLISSIVFSLPAFYVWPHLWPWQPQILDFWLLMGKFLFCPWVWCFFVLVLVLLFSWAEKKNRIFFYDYRYIGYDFFHGNWFFTVVKFNYYFGLWLIKHERQLRKLTVRWTLKFCFWRKSCIYENWKYWRWKNLRFS